MDTQALERAAVRYGDSIYRVALHATGQSADAEDVLQEVLLERCRTKMRFASEEHERRWLLRVAVNKSHDAVRKRRWNRLRPLEAAVELYAPEDAHLRAVYDAVCALPPNQRLAVDLYYYEGYATAEITSILHAREATVRTWLHRARAKLKTLLEDEDHA